uniref:Uncharacterized protein n=1 Tax=Anguilla anguilla TaxID=7936 RepID=A0A0E9WCZ2_ANGAN
MVWREPSSVIAVISTVGSKRGCLLNHLVRVPESCGAESRGGTQQVHVPGPDSHWHGGCAVLQQRH